MHQTNAVLESTMVSPVSAPLMTAAPYYSSSIVPTPPPSVSPIDLPPILELSSRECITNDHPPSPASPKKQDSALPAYLEPSPRVNDLNATSRIRPQLFHLLAPPLMSFSARRSTAPAITHHHQQQTLALSSSLPPRRSYSQSMDSIRPNSMAPSGNGTGMMITTQFLSTSSNSSASSSPTTVHQHNISKKRKFYNEIPSSVLSADLLSTPSSLFHGQHQSKSPTLTAACASAAKSHASMTCIPLSPTQTDDDKKQMVGQSMFLTKNAHIKRPRNAWIHFRCHYGQALKSQDPSLRAEEISKRASRRWSLLSENEKRPWHQLAEQEKQAHKEAFPEYRYCPKRATTVINQPSSPTTHQQGPYRLPRLPTDQKSK